MGTDDEIVAQHTFSKNAQTKLPRVTQMRRAEINAFIAGAFFMCEVARLHNIRINLDDVEVLAAAYALYPEYDPLPEPTKAHEGTTGDRADGMSQT
jgi:hypothetical protein